MASFRSGENGRVLWHSLVPPSLGVVDGTQRVLRGSSWLVGEGFVPELPSDLKIKTYPTAWDHRYFWEIYQNRLLRALSGQYFDSREESEADAKKFLAWIRGGGGGG